MQELFLTGSPGVKIKNNPEFANVEWGAMISRVYSCDEPYLKGKNISIANISKNGEPWDVVLRGELVTDEDGVWKGQCEGTMTPTAEWPEKGKCTFTGESIYKGLVMTMEWEGDAIKLRIVKPEEAA